MKASWGKGKGYVGERVHGRLAFFKSQSDAAASWGCGKGLTARYGNEGREGFKWK